MMQILIIIILAWIAMNISILALIKLAVKRDDYWQSQRDRLSKYWEKSKEI